MKETKTQKLVVSAMLIALGTAVSFVSEQIPFLNLPFGGTITLASLAPLVILSYMYGIRWGAGAAFVYSILQMAVGFRTVSALFIPSDEAYVGVATALLIILLDYVLAFTSVGLAGIFREKLPKAKALVLGAVVGCTLCYVFHTLSGFIFYGAWAEWFFLESAAKDFALSHWVMDTFTGSGLSLVYSIVYNGCYMLPEIILTSVAAGALSKIPRIKKA